LVIQYQGDDWIFWNRAVFNIDGENNTLDASRLDVNHHNSSGTVWETLDQQVLAGTVGADEIQATEMIAPLVAKLLIAKSVSLRLVGQSLEDRTISAGELQRLQRVGKTFFALFGMVDKETPAAPPAVVRP
jgi:hypothetical protein